MFFHCSAEGGDSFCSLPQNVTKIGEEEDVTVHFTTASNSFSILLTLLQSEVNKAELKLPNSFLHSPKSAVVCSGFVSCSVSGRQAAGRRPAGVHQQRVTDRGDVRGGQEHPDTYQTQVTTQHVQLLMADGRRYTYIVKMQHVSNFKNNSLSCRPDPTVEIAFIRRRSSSSSSSGPHSPIALQGSAAGGGAQTRPPGMGAAPQQPATVTRMTSSRNPASETLPAVNVSQVCASNWTHCLEPEAPSSALCIMMVCSCLQVREAPVRTEQTRVSSSPPEGDAISHIHAGMRLR